MLTKLSRLAKRVAELPEGVPAESIYEEMKRLGETKRHLEMEVKDTKRQTEDTRIVSYTQFERLLNKLRNQLTAITPETKRRIIHALIQKVVVTREGFELHYYVGTERIRDGEDLIAPPEIGPKKNLASGSLLTNGGSCLGTNELVQPVARLSYGERWAKKKIDVLELVTLRREGMTMREIGRRLGVAKTSVLRALRLAGGSDGNGD